MVIFSILLINTVCAEDNSTTNLSVSEDDFNSIQILIDNAQDGGSVHLDGKTYQGNGSVISINKDISIYGSSSSNTVLDANYESNIFYISKNVNVNVYNLTFVNGKTSLNGAAIDNYGTLTIKDSKFINNYAECGAIRGSTGSRITVYNSLFEDNNAEFGAAIDSYTTTAKIINCTFIKNHSHEGGAIYNRFGDIQLINSTFINNSATRGGGIYNNRGYLIVKNSKFYSNSASHLGGGVKSWGMCDIYDSDIRNNSGQYGGGVYISEDTMHVENSIIENNRAEEGGGLISDSYGTLIIQNSRIDNNYAICGGGISSTCGHLNASNCIFNNNVAKEEGGGIYSTLGTIASVRFTVYLQDIVLNNNSAKYGGGLALGEVKNNIVGLILANNTAVDGGAIHNAGNLNLDKFTITSNSANAGGAIYNKGTINLTNSKVSSNSADKGGAIYNNAEVNVIDSIFEYNNAKSDGGVAYSSGSLNVVNGTFNYNGAIFAGVIYNVGKLTAIEHSSFNNNKAERGAVIYSDSDLLIDNSKFQKNTVTHSLGVIDVAKGNVNISNSLFNLNTGSDEGGVIFNINGTILVNNSQFTSNVALSYGGAIDNAGKLTIINSLFDKNQAYGAGAIDNGGELTIIKSNFTNNKATKNGGAIDNNDQLNIVGSIFENNVAGNQGGAIIARKDINLTHSSLFANDASAGEAIFINGNCSNVSNNWWGDNNPNFEKLLNIGLSDDVKWIVMSLETSSQMMQYEKASVNVKLNELMNKDGAISKLDSPELLPALKVTMVGGNDVLVNNGIFADSVVIPGKNPVVFKLNNQTYSFKTSKNPSKITNNKNVIVDYNGKATFKVRVIGNNGKTVGKNEVVVMKINGKTYNVKTNAKGYASKTFDFTPGKYTIKTTYKCSTVKNTITIKNVLKANGATIKKSKKINYSATLKTSKNKVIPGKKITFKINGKTYTAKTNKKGIATVSFNNLKVGKYSVVVKYLKSQVKTTLKIKK